MKTKICLISIVAVIAAAVYGLGVYHGESGTGLKFSKEVEAKSSHEQPLISPVLPTMREDVYYPGTEGIASDEMRITALGTGMPWPRPSQAGPCFLVELGNGDKFLFDVGTGSMPNVAALMIPYDFLDKVFLTHLHTDHWGDLTTLWAGGWTAG